MDFVGNGSVFDCLDKDEQLFEYIDFGDYSDMSVLTEKIKSDWNDNDGLMLFNEKTVEELGKLYQSFEKQEFSLDEVCYHPSDKYYWWYCR